MLAGSQSEKDPLQGADEALEVPQKKRGLLHVPSRSSSHKIQPSPTTTGLSGATVSDPRDSIGDGSKGSKGSISGRRRNGSAGSSKMSITPTGAVNGPAGTTNTATPTSSTSQKPKKKSFLSLLCCIAPDHAHTTDPSEANTPANKVAKAPGDRPTTASKPEQSPAGQHNTVSTQPQSEKEALKQEGIVKQSTNVDSSKAAQSEKIVPAAASVDVNRSAGDARDQPLPKLPTEESSEQAGHVNSAVIVQSAPKPESSNNNTESTSGREDGNGDVASGKSEPAGEKSEISAPTTRDEASNKATLPPPPPVPESTTSEAAPEPEQKWLLPPIAPRFKGKKCLVLDLDETLVHSSFKVCSFSKLAFSC